MIERAINLFDRIGFEIFLKDFEVVDEFVFEFRVPLHSFGTGAYRVRKQHFHELTIRRT